MAETKVSTPESNLLGSKLDATTEFVKRLCLAESLGRIYSVAHPKGKAAVEAAYAALVPLLELAGTVPISMVEGKILVAGLPVEERNPLVARFINSFQQLYVDNIVFTKGLTLPEFEEFFRLVLKGAKAINAAGGLEALLRQSGIAHVQVQRVSYVLVHEDEKVVKRDAQVLPSTSIPPELADRKIVEYMISQVLEKAEQRRWLINRIKNSPTKMAELITEGIELALSRAEAGLTPEKTIEGLLENVKLVCQSMAEAAPDENGDPDALRQAVLTLEKEVRARSKKLMSSEAAVGFVNELLSVITRYADRVRAEKISAELLKHESDLRQLERLLKKLAPPDTSAAKFVEGIRELLVQKGVTPEQLKRLDEAAKSQDTRGSARRAARTPEQFRQALEELLGKYGFEPDRVGQLAQLIGAQLNRELRARTSALERANKELRNAVECFRIAFAELGFGAVVWDENGIVTFADEIIELEF
ncbi:MAG: hypothetical protein RMH97_08480, partial [Verrucomicrobiales bacterium]|nr:hypothetical protein [Verrucomicrobiales bacterium]